MADPPPPLADGPDGSGPRLRLGEYGTKRPDVWGSTPPGIERMRRSFAGAEPGLTRELQAYPGLLRTPLFRPVLVSGIIFIGALNAMVGGVVWLQVSRGDIPLSDGLGLLAFGVGLGGFLTYVTGVGMTSIGIAITNEGVQIFERGIKPGRGLRRLTPWSDIGPLKLNPGGFFLQTEGIGVNLTVDQGRALSNDERYPYRGKLPPEVRKRLDRGR